MRALQCVINDTRLGPVTVDGFYGPETQAAIKKLTDNFECSIENRFLVRTWYWTILFAQSHRLAGSSSATRASASRPCSAPCVPTGRRSSIDGDFGTQTHDRVREFQEKCDIKVTGRVNDQTSFFFSQGGCG